MLAKSFPKMSALELHDMQIPSGHQDVFCLDISQIDDKSGTSIADSTVWTGSRTLDHLVEFIVKGVYTRIRSIF